jgi:hypothetical protein
VKARIKATSSFVLLAVLVLVIKSDERLKTCTGVIDSRSGTLVVRPIILESFSPS